MGAVQKSLHQTIGKRRINQCIEDLLRPQVLGATPDDGYRAMAADQEREAKALACCNALAVDVADEARRKLPARIRSRSE